jgi:hypothetical protein
LPREHGTQDNDDGRQVSCSKSHASGLALRLHDALRIVFQPSR